jgi:hypothetical protein
MYFPKSGDGMMLLQFFGSESNGFSSLGFVHSSHPQQLNSAAAIMILSPIKNSFSVNFRTFAPLSLIFASSTASLSFATFAFQS